MSVEPEPKGSTPHEPLPVGPAVTLPPLAAPVDELWHLLLDMTESLTAPWTLVGGQMVLLHALEHGQVPAQVSQDGDVIADIRAQQDAITTVVRWLGRAGFALDGMSPDLIAHRYTRATSRSELPIVVDVLAPDRVGSRVDLRTTPPGRTVEVPAGSQALKRTVHVTVIHEGRVGRVPRPSLLAPSSARRPRSPCPATPTGTFAISRSCSALCPTRSTCASRRQPTIASAFETHGRSSTRRTARGLLHLPNGATTAKPPCTSCSADDPHPARCMWPSTPATSEPHLFSVVLGRQRDRPMQYRRPHCTLSVDGGASTR